MKNDVIKALLLITLIVLFHIFLTIEDKISWPSENNYLNPDHENSSKKLPHVVTF